MVTRLPFLFLIAALTHGAFAQTYVTSPPGYASKEGMHRTRYFASGRDHRVQLMDGELRGRSMTVREAAFRFNADNYSREYGRRWSQVTLHVADCDARRVHNIFARNPTSTPTRVFAASVNLPGRNGYYGQRPEPNWLRFPFSAPWSYAGTADILLDFTFQGGVLANNGTWPYYKEFAYGFDSYAQLVYDYTYNAYAKGVSSPVYYGSFATSARCVDPTASQQRIAEPMVFASVYTPQHPSRHRRNRVQVQVGARNTRARGNVMFAFGVSGSRDGLAIPGVACNRLHVDLTQPTLYFGIPAYGPYTGKAYPVGSPIYHPSWARIPIWTQCAYVHTKSGELILSPAVRVLVPEMPRSHLRHTAYGYRTSTSGWTTHSTERNPIIRYRK